MRGLLTQRRLVVMVLVLALLLAGAVGDGLLRRYVEGRIVASVADVSGGPARASLDGWPATWHVLRDDYPLVSGSVSGVRARVRGYDVTADVELVAQGVTGLSRGPVHVQDATGQVRTRGRTSRGPPVSPCRARTTGCSRSRRTCGSWVSTCR